MSTFVDTQKTMNSRIYPVPWTFEAVYKWIQVTIVDTYKYNFFTKPV